MSRRKGLTFNDHMEIVRLYLMEERTMVEVGALMGVSSVSVWKVLRKLGVQHRHRSGVTKRRSPAPSPMTGGRDQDAPSGTGSRADAPSPSVSALPGFDPSRTTPST